ncbi:hypothetical protein DXG01_003943 [Tephrocybe rancida]|nr:hypothetical protein DXG01_003943 [Tephrocybe rancida]
MTNCSHREVSELARGHSLLNDTRALPAAGDPFSRVSELVGTLYSSLTSAAKSLSSRCKQRRVQDTVKDAVQIFGRHVITCSGIGKFIEHVPNVSLPYGFAVGTAVIHGSILGASWTKYLVFFKPPTTITLKESTTDEAAQHAKSGDLRIVVDSKVYTLSKYISVTSQFFQRKTSDVTGTFFSLHRYEVLQRLRYGRLQIGTISGRTQTVLLCAPEALSKIPHAELTWLTTACPHYDGIQH